MWPSHDFQKGDIVKLRNGTALQEVVGVKAHTISTNYLDTHHVQQNRAAADFERISRVSRKSKSKPKKEDTEMTKALYKTPDDKYGTMIAKDSKGHFVLELKGGGGVQSFKPEDLEEVVPFTVQVNWMSNSNTHIEVPEGELVVGDIVVAGFNLGRVTALDTKNRSPQSCKDLRKVGTTKVG